MEKTLHNTFCSKHSLKKNSSQPRFYSFFQFFFFLFSFSNAKENEQDRNKEIWLTVKLRWALKHCRQWYCMSDQGNVLLGERERGIHKAVGKMANKPPLVIMREACCLYRQKALWKKVCLLLTHSSVNSLSLLSFSSTNKKTGLILTHPKLLVLQTQIL